MNTDQIIAIDTEARQGFTYKADTPGRDTWRTHIAEVLGGRTYSDDCDGLTTTALDLMAAGGAPLDRIYRLIVETTGGGKEAHMLAAILNDDGRFWTLADCNDPPAPAEECSYVPIVYQRMDEVALDPTACRDGFPWA